jgi:predicted permease
MIKDLHIAIRGLSRSLPAAVTIVLCLGFGTGAVTLVYSWHQGLLRHPLPAVPRMDELVTIRSQAVNGSTLTSFPEYLDWRDSAQTLSGLAASSLYLFGVSTGGGDDAPAEPVYGVFASANYFRVLDVPITIGRDFEPADDGFAARGIVAIISDRFWRGHLGGAPDVVGRTIRVNGQWASIVGVAAPQFGGTLAGVGFDIWVPLHARPSLVPAETGSLDSRTRRWLDVTGRRRPEASLAQTREEFALTARRMAEAYVESRGHAISVVPLDTGVLQQLRPLFISLLALTTVVLLIVCSNVANLLLVRGASRMREIAIRFALGATRARVVMMLMTENALLAVAGTAVGVAVSTWGRHALIRLIPTTTIPLSVDVPFDVHMRIFVIVLTSATVMLFGLMPALVTSRIQFTRGLAGGTRGTTAGRNRTRAMLVSAQFALSLTTLIGASLFMHRARSLHALDPGFSEPAHVLLVQSESALAGYRDLSEWQTRLDEIAGRVAELPGVRVATWATFVPLGFVGYTRRDVAIEGYIPRADESMRVLVNGVGDRYFELMGIPILEGRPITADDAPGRIGVAVINQVVARRFWPEGSAIGRRLSIEGRSLTVVGIARDGRYDYRLLDQPAGPLIYYALVQSPARFVTLHARTDMPALTAAPAIRSMISDIDPGFATLAPVSLSEYTRAPMMPFEIALVVLGVLGLAALLLSATGLQAVIAYGVAVRTREIGIRLALGASSRQVVGLFVRQALLMTVLGVLAGLASTAAILPALGHALAPKDAVDFATVIGPLVLLVTAGLVAGSLTAWRATRIDPAHTLRTD